MTKYNDKEKEFHDKLDKIQNNLDWIVSYLTRNNLIPRQPTYPGPYNPGNTYVSNCPTCGIKLEGTMSYSCSRMDCPVGLGPAISKL